MRVFKCDKCGKQVILSEKSDGTNNRRSVELFDDYGRLYNRFDLCEGCLKEFIRWVGKVN